MNTPDKEGLEALRNLYIVAFVKNAMLGDSWVVDIGQPPSAPPWTTRSQGKWHWPYTPRRKAEMEYELLSEELFSLYLEGDATK